MIPALLALQLAAAPVPVDLNVLAWQAMLEWSSQRKRKRPRIFKAPPPKIEDQAGPRRVTTTSIPICEIAFSFEEIWRCRVSP